MPGGSTIERADLMSPELQCKATWPTSGVRRNVDSEWSLGAASALSQNWGYGPFPALEKKHVSLATWFPPSLRRPPSLSRLSRLASSAAARRYLGICMALSCLL